MSRDLEVTVEQKATPHRFCGWQNALSKSLLLRARRRILLGEHTSRKQPRSCHVIM